MAACINNNGQVVGCVVGRSRGNAAGLIVRAFIYREGKMADLNSLVDPALGWTLLSANQINDLGQIAGYGFAPGGGNILHAFLLTPVVAQASRLHEKEETAGQTPASRGDNAK